MIPLCTKLIPHEGSEHPAPVYNSHLNDAMLVLHLMNSTEQGLWGQRLCNSNPDPTALPVLMYFLLLQLSLFLKVPLIF